MPSTYAHKKFAKEVKDMLPAAAAEAAEKHPSLYLAGCHGPDILFYYKAVKYNKVNAFGYGMHEQPAYDFFERAKSFVRTGGEKYLSYITGFITHFALDSSCHGYVEEARKALGITHTKLEVEFDRSLLESEGKNALREKLASHIEWEKDMCGVISSFFPFTPEIIKRALKDMKTICNLFVCPNGVKRGIVTGVLKMVSKELPDQVMTVVPEARCAETNAVMREKFENAKPLAAFLAEDFLKNLNGEGLDKYFYNNYE